MKRCPECRRDYYDETLLYCLDDGARLVDGPGTVEHPTAVLTDPPSESPTRVYAHRERAVGEARNRNAVIVGLVGIVLVALLGVGSYWYYANDDTREIDSIAVMPFVSEGSDPEAEYLSQQLPESLIYRLSQVSDLKVSPSSSVIKYRGTQIDPIQAGVELGVNAVLVGRITQRGDGLVVSAELIDVRNKKSIWGEHYDRKLSDTLSTQREIAREIAEALKIQVSREQGLTKNYTNSNDAYLLQMQGRFLLEKRTKPEMDRSLESFRKAILLDPNFALAYVGIADTYNAMVPYGYMKPREAFEESRAAAKRALEIDPLLAEAHSAYAFVIGAYDWNWAEAERGHKRAIDLSPNRAGPYHNYAAGYLVPAGRLEDAEAAFRKATEIEPASVPSNGRLATVLRYARRFDEALAQARKANDLDPSSLANRSELMLSLLQKGQIAEAIRIGEESLAAAPDYPQVVTSLGLAYARAGRSEDARKKIAEWEETTRNKGGYSSRIARIYVALGERENALATLEKAFEDRDWFLLQARVAPEYDAIRDDPRFIDLMRRMNLPNLGGPERK